MNRASRPYSDDAEGERGNMNTAGRSGVAYIFG